MLRLTVHFRNTTIQVIHNTYERDCEYMYSSPSIVRSFGFKKFMMTILARKIRSFGWPLTRSHKKCHRTRHYVAVVAGQKARNQKRHRRVRRIPAGSKLWSTRARTGCSVSRISGKIRRGGGTFPPRRFRPGVFAGRNLLGKTGRNEEKKRQIWRARLC